MTIFFIRSSNDCPIDNAMKGAGVPGPPAVATHGIRKTAGNDFAICGFDG
jgi:hypothetical protein